MFPCHTEKNNHEKKNKRHAKFYFISVEHFFCYVIVYNTFKAHELLLSLFSQRITDGTTINKKIIERVGSGSEVKKYFFFLIITLKYFANIFNSKY